ncbi:MAG: type II toxin-antitoxin system VapC family toxin [Sulfuricellaceae bacterium]
MRRVYLDACVVIYLIENVASFSELTRQFLARNGDAILCVSPLVRMEVIVKPLRESASVLVSDYEDFLATQRWLVIDDSIFDRALQLRARHGLKTPDALHLATALHHGCVEIWTNDERLNKAAGGMAVNVLAG